MDVFEFFIAEISLRLEKRFVCNGTWLGLRRRVIFYVYDRDVCGRLAIKDIFDLLEDMSQSEKSPEEFGIRNILWSARQEENKNLIVDEFDLQTLSKVLTIKTSI